MVMMTINPSKKLTVKNPNGEESVVKPLIVIFINNAPTRI